MNRRVNPAVRKLLAIAIFFCVGQPIWGQVVITEVMYQPGGNQNLWEWVEIWNTSDEAVNLDGWVFDDDDDVAVGGAMSTVGNILAAPNNNTIVPAGGIAVLYPGSDLDFTTSRFTNAWGSGITLIGVTTFTNLTEGEAFGLWSSRSSYNSDAIPGSTMSPRRTFNSAVASFSLATLDAADDGFSFAWNGTGSVTDPANWVQSEEDALGAFVSGETTIPSVPINSTLDRGNPGVLPAGALPSGLRITEIMYEPESPHSLASGTGLTSNDFEWIEVVNNRATTIDFSITNFVLDDIAGAPISSANIKQGVLDPGDVGVLFNSERISAGQMTAMWGEGTYIPVERWPGLNNSESETFGLWQSIDDYNDETASEEGRSFDHADVVVTYDTRQNQGWPSTSAGQSIWLEDLSGDPNVGDNWAEAETGDEGDMLSFDATAIFSESTPDHPGGDIGSPGYVPGVVVEPLFGDYNGNNVVDAADYVEWRKALVTATPLSNDMTPESVSTADFGVWRQNFGNTRLSESAFSAANVPEPAGGLLVLVATMVVALGHRTCGAWI